MNIDADITKPTKKQVLVPFLILVITLIIGASLLFAAKKAGSNEEAEMIFYAPGTQVLNITRPGEYVVDVALETTYEGKTYLLPEDFTGIGAELKFKNEPVLLTAIIGNVYGNDGQKGKTLFTFNAEEPGEYALTTTLEHMTATEAVLVARRTDSNGAKIILFATAACFIILMGACQFIAYSAYNLIRWGMYVYHRR